MAALASTCAFAIASARLISAAPLRKSSRLSPCPCMCFSSVLHSGTLPPRQHVRLYNPRPYRCRYSLSWFRGRVLIVCMSLPLHIWLVPSTMWVQRTLISFSKGRPLPAELPHINDEYYSVGCCRQSCVGRGWSGRWQCRRTLGSCWKT